MASPSCAVASTPNDRGGRGGRGQPSTGRCGAESSPSPRPVGVTPRTATRAFGVPAGVNVRHGTDATESWPGRKELHRAGDALTFSRRPLEIPRRVVDRTRPGQESHEQPKSRDRGRMPHAVRPIRDGVPGPDGRRPREGVRARAPRAHGGRPRLDRHGGHGAGGPLGQGPEPRPRGLPRGRAAEVGPRPHRQPRLRLREPGDRRRGLLDPARSRGRRDRRRRGEPLRRADPAQPAHGAHPGGDAEGEVVRRPPGLARPGAAARPRAGRPGHRRAVHRPDDGPVGREDGQGERHHARGAGPDRLRLAPQRLGRDAGRAAAAPRPARFTFPPPTRRR